MSTSTRRAKGRPRKVPASRQRALVLEAARDVFATAGVRAATIGQIAGAAGVSRQSVYEQFGDKNALFREVVDAVENQALATIGANAISGTELDVRSWARSNYGVLFAFMAENPTAWPVLQEAERAGIPALTRLRARLADVYLTQTSQRWKQHGIDPGRAAQALVAMYFAMTEALATMPWEGKQPDNEALVDLLTEFTVGGVTRLHERTPSVIERFG